MDTGMRRTACSILLAAFAVAACSSSGSDGARSLPADDAYTPPVQGLRADSVLDVGGLDRYFDVYVPPALPQDAAMVVLLHGGGQNKARVIDGATGSSGWRTVAEEENFLLLIPNGADENGDPVAANASWNDCRADQAGGSKEDDVAFVSDLIDWALTSPDFSIDPDRVYVTGASNGGMMSYRIALELDDRVAAIAAFIANNPVNLDPDCAAAVAEPDPDPVSVFVCNGTLDVLMPFDGGQVAFGNGGEVASTAETRAFWRERVGAAEDNLRFFYPNLDQTDGSTVSRTTDTGGADGAEVQVLVVQGGGHTMPSRQFFSAGLQNHDIESAREAWRFLESKRR